MKQLNALSTQRFRHLESVQALQALVLQYQVQSMDLRTW
jgi:hypothetical protein